jgi:hypothetical protein
MVRRQCVLKGDGFLRLAAGTDGNSSSQFARLQKE